MLLRIESARFHRNGSWGASYVAIRFRAWHDGEWVALDAILFDRVEHCAVLDDSGASWRCEQFESELRAFIRSPQGERMLFGDYALCPTANEA